MAMQSSPDLRLNTGSDFADSAVLEAVVPRSSEIDLQDVFQAWDGEFPEDSSATSSSIVPFIDQRQFLLLDELVSVYVVLRTPAVGEDELKAQLSRLSITVEAHAVGQQVVKPGDATHPPLFKDAKELLASELVQVSEDPLICAAEIEAEGNAESVQYIYIFWKVIIPLGRPRGRLQKLAVFFTPSASLAPSQSPTPSSSNDDDYLPSRVPLAANLLQPLAHDPALGHLNPYLSVSRFTQQSGIAIPKQLARTIRSGPKKLFRAAPAFLWRIRFLRFPSLAEKNAILACFDIEVTQFASCPVSLDTVSVQLSSGTYEPLGVNLPHKGQTGELLTLIYKLHPPSTPDPSRTLSIGLSATALISKECTPKIKIKWKTALELPQQRPNSRSGLLQPPLPQQSHALHDQFSHDALTMTGQVAEVEPPSAIARGVSMTISAPEAIFVAEVFRWEILVVNRSEQMQRFAIVPIPKRRGDVVPGVGRPTSMDRKGSKRGVGFVASPIVDDGMVYSLLKSSMLDGADLVCVSPEARTGTLGPSSCHVTELLFLPLVEGVLHLEALRLVDLNSQQVVDVRQIPDIVVKPRRG